MQISYFAIFAIVGLAAAAPSQSKIEKRDEHYDVGVCNGTSCYVNFVNTVCSIGSCVGPGGGDGARCHVMKGWGNAYCPVNCDKYYCP
ncbi:hypothetical protein GB937_009718 [Aspergillus fischeri]|nr:hypothetical protein GB937_009718 [Aspergillus fischeri]